jgi:hypothetical protein
MKNNRRFKLFSDFDHQPESFWHLFPLQFFSQTRIVVNDLNERIVRKPSYYSFSNERAPAVLDVLVGVGTDTEAAIFADFIWKEK